MVLPNFFGLTSTKPKTDRMLMDTPPIRQASFSSAELALVGIYAGSSVGSGVSTGIGVGSGVGVVVGVAVGRGVAIGIEVG